MNISRNPFMRGYHRVDIEQVIFISDDHDFRHLYRPLHPSQRHLRHDQIIRHVCTFNDHFVLITEGQTLAPDIDAGCTGTGIVQSALYALYGHKGETLVHIGDIPLQASAQAIAQDLTFETGFYSRCWEISSAHLPQVALDYLDALADRLTPSGLLFEAFRIAASPALGVKLISTPWNDEHLHGVEHRSADELQREHWVMGVPDALINVLHLAGQADIRMLVFDAGAPLLEGLRVYGHT